MDLLVKQIEVIGYLKRDKERKIDVWEINREVRFIKRIKV
jgi:hypothetical protein